MLFRQEFLIKIITIGERIVLEQNMRYFLPRAAIEHLVRQGLLKEIEKQV